MGSQEHLKYMDENNILTLGSFAWHDWFFMSTATLYLYTIVYFILCPTVHIVNAGHTLSISAPCDRVYRAESVTNSGVLLKCGCGIMSR